MDKKEQEPWYIKYGGGYLADLWKYLGGYLFYLWFVVPVVIIIIAIYGWEILFSSFLDRYPGVYQVLEILAWLPYGYLVGPALVMGLGVGPVICLLFFLWRKTSVGQSRAGQTILVFIGITMVCLAIGMGCGTLNALT